MTWRQAPLYVETHDLARWLLERTAGWPPQHALAARLSTTACELVEAVALALTFPARRPAHLEAADESIVRLRGQLRLAGELDLLSAGGLRFATGRLQAAGRMLGGWRKRVGEGGGSSAARRRRRASGDGPLAAAGA